MTIKSWAAVSALAVFACGNTDQELPDALPPEAQMPSDEIPSIEVDQSTDAVSDFFNCFQAGNCQAPALSNSTTCLRNRDYSITVNQTASPVVILSIHGGRIEPPSSDITRVAAQRFGWNRYDFSADGTQACLRGRTNRDRLHITATHFDDPVAVRLVSQHTKAVTIHTDRNITSAGMICVGGDNETERLAFINSVNANRSQFNLFTLRPVNAPATTAFPCGDAQGIANDNIVNRVGGGRGGLQLEFSSTLLADLNDPSVRFDPLRRIIYNALGTAMSR